MTCQKKLHRHTVSVPAIARVLSVCGEFMSCWTEIMTEDHVGNCQEVLSLVGDVVDWFMPRCGDEEKCTMQFTKSPLNRLYASSATSMDTPVYNHRYNNLT